jgi:hypothetical protein
MCRRFCGSGSSRINSFPELRRKWLLIPKDFREENLRTHLVPNHIPILIEIYGILLLARD